MNRRCRRIGRPASSRGFESLRPIPLRRAVIPPARLGPDTQMRAVPCFGEFASKDGHERESRYIRAADPPRTAAGQARTGMIRDRGNAGCPGIPRMTVRAVGGEASGCRTAGRHPILRSGLGSTSSNRCRRFGTRRLVFVFCLGDALWLHEPPIQQSNLESEIRRFGKLIISYHRHRRDIGSKPAPRYYTLHFRSVTIATP